MHIRTIARALLAAGVLALGGAGCITVGRGVPYIPDPSYRGITPDVAKKALEDELHAARTMDGNSLSSIKVDDKSVSFSYDMRNEHHDITVRYATEWCGIATDIFMAPKDLPYAIGFYKEDVYVDFGYFWFAKLEDAEKFVDAWAAMELAQGGAS